MGADSTGIENELYFYHGDHLSSTQMITDVNGAVQQQVLYAPFGEEISEYNAYWHQGKVPDYMFNAKEMDEESGMYYYSARYYAPPVFISRDPLFEKYPTLSPYCYTANNPVKYVDPDGRKIRNPRNMVLSNRTLIRQMKLFDRSVAKLSNQSVNSYTFIITGGDRYMKDGKIYSASNGGRVGNSASKSYHLQERGALAVDIKLTDGTVSSDIMEQAAKEVGMRINPNGEPYTDGHIHLDIKNYQGNMEYEDNQYRPTNADFDHNNENMNISDYLKNNPHKPQESFFDVAPEQKTSKKMQESKSPIIKLIGNILENAGY
jgi:RHS repeat-associated protein